MSKKNHKNILVVIPTGDYPERLKLEGILKYARERTGTQWNLELDIGGTVGRLLGGKSAVSYDGIIAYVQSDRERETIWRIGLPAVLIEDLKTPSAPARRKGTVSILCDHFAEGRTAARYFMDRHYTNFAFVGTRPPTGWSVQRRNGFVATLKSENHACFIHDGRKDKIEFWLRNLPKPCALLAARDLCARQVLSAAINANIAIPQDLAILGVDNDETLCTTCAPALSSIPTFDRSLGYAAGRALSQLLAHKISGGTIRTRHAQVVSRPSTDSDALSDPFVANALRWARNHLDRKDLGAKTLAAAIGYSSKQLLTRANRALGLTLAETIRKERLNAGLELLRNAELPIAEIAERCGYANVSHFSLRVKAATGLTPHVYRRQEQAARPSP